MITDYEKFIDDKYNYFECVCEKGISKNGYQEFIFKVKGTDIEIFRKWVNKKNKDDNCKRGTGGKKAYIKLYVSNLMELISLGISCELLGFIIKLIPYIQWGTGLLIKRSGKQATPVLYTDLIKLLGRGDKYSKNIIKQLKVLELLEHTKDGYKISSDLMQKGGVKHEDNNL